MGNVNFSLNGTKALVTGGSSGLGPAIVKALDKAGARVAIHYHSNRSGAEQLATTLDSAPSLIQADLADADQVGALFTAAAEALAGVNLLINCAATESQMICDLAEMDAARWRTTQQANVEAPMQLIRDFAAQGGPGVVINISSIEASRPAQSHGHYSVSKAALEMLTQSAALEFGSLGIRVNAIAPGLIWRDGIETGWPEGVEAWKSAAPLGQLVSPENLADAVLFLASDSAASITGTILTVDCGLSIRQPW